MEFSNGGTKLERFLPKNQHTQRKLLNWCNAEVSKSARIRFLKSIFYVKNLPSFKNLFYPKVSITKNVFLNWYSSMKKKLRKIQIIFHKES